MEVTSLALLSTKMAHMNVMQEVNISLLGTIMDQMEQSGDMMTRLMNAAHMTVPADATPPVIDVRI